MLTRTFNSIVALCILYSVNALNLDLVWILDGSASIGRDNFRNIKDMVKRTSELVELERNVTFDIIEFGKRVKLYAPGSSESFYSTLGAVSPNIAGTSRTSNAFKALYTDVFNGTATHARVVVLFSDGVPKPGPEFGGTILTREVQMAVNVTGITKIIFVNVRNTKGTASSNPRMLNKVSPPYNNATDLMLMNFRRRASTASVDELVEKILGAPEPPTEAPTQGPTTSPTAAPTAEPTTMPSASPNVSPTPVPTTAKPTAFPTAKPTTANPTTPAPTTEQPTTAAPTITSDCEEFNNTPYIWVIVLLSLIVLFFILRELYQKKETASQELESTTA